jgi:hypothetical protein
MLKGFVSDVGIIRAPAKILDVAGLVSQVYLCLYLLTLKKTLANSHVKPLNHQSSQSKTRNLLKINHLPNKNKSA